MIPAGFHYHAPRSVADAIQLLGSLGPEAKLLAGGHSLLPMMKLRFATPSALIDLGKIPDLKGISQSGGEIRIGAMTTEHELLNSKLVAEQLPLLAEGAGQIADPQVRYRGTIGGDICHGDPANDHPALMVALDASFVLSGPKGERVVKAESYFVGLYETLAQADEILTQIRIPVPAAGTGWSYTKFKRKTGDFATAAAAVLLQMKGSTVARVSMALTNAGPTPLKCSAVESYLVGKTLDTATLNEAARLATEPCAPGVCLRGDADYKTAMAGEMARRALQIAQSRAKA
jgi:carbon-monoxide dehydrogenase medium subunit